MNMRTACAWLAGLLTALVLCSVAIAQAQPSTSPQVIYTCVDGKGRKLTSDRPIADCLDREQKVLNPSGSVKGTLGPTLTAQERIEQEARQRHEAEERARQAEEKRRERALLMRYPSKSMHDKERAEALAQIAVVKQAAVNRVAELMKQRDEVQAEMEFYKKDPSKAPPTLRRQSEDIVHSMSVQGRFIADQEAEVVRLNARFDEELARLKQLWALQSPVSPPPTAKPR